ncbi:phenylpyruvate tautomerase MIF-related protein [Caproiciproducens sp. LBM24188]|nr:hypothetical protein [Oscillospiraceae bacterium]
MPCIELKTNVKISPEKEEAIKSKFGQVISILPGKSEQWLMVSLEDECRLYFKGNNQTGIAFVQVNLYGKGNADAYNKLTAAITQLLNQELGISPANIYVKYEETNYWGWNGSNF